MTREIGSTASFSSQPLSNCKAGRKSAAGGLNSDGMGSFDAIASASDGLAQYANAHAYGKR